VTAGTGKTRSYDLNGTLLWELSGASEITIPTSLSHQGLLYVASGFIMDKKKPLYAIRPGAQGDISLKEGETSNAFIAWCQPKGAPYNPSILAYKGLIYVLLDPGALSCYDAKTGAPLYEKQRLPKGNAYTVSPWAYNDKIFCLSEDGDTHVIQAGPSFSVLRTNSLNDTCMASPAIANGSLILRTATKLCRIQKAD
jgi:outer membrane protein assembly factor BamB